MCVCEGEEEGMCVCVCVCVCVGKAGKMGRGMTGWERAEMGARWDGRCTDDDDRCGGGGGRWRWR